MITRIQFLSLLLLLTGCGKQPATEKATGVPQRIISMAPYITETVYALGLGDRLVGATTYCTYPAAAKAVPRVGGFGQYNYEAIVSLKPDLVILHAQQEAEKTRLQGLGIPVLETRSEYVTDIMEAISDIGLACDAENEANALLETVDAKISDLKQHRAPLSRILVTFGSSTGPTDDIYAFGSDCLHTELLQLAGGRNVVENNLAFSSLSKEAVIRLNPDIIIQLAPGTAAPEDPSKAWNALAGVSAVKNNRIYVLTGDYTCIPGPRFIQILDDFSEIIRQND